MFVFNVLAWLMPGKAVDYLIRQINRAATALQAAEARQHRKVAQIETQISQLRDTKAVAAEEAKRIARIGKNLVDIIA